MQVFQKSRLVSKYFVGIICGLSIVLSSVSIPGCIPTKTSQQIVDIDNDVLLALQSLSNAYSMFCQKSDSRLCAVNDAKFEKLVGDVIAAVNVFNEAVKAGTVGSTKEQMQQAYDSLYNFLEELGIIRTISQVESEQKPDSSLSVKMFSFGAGASKSWEPVMMKHERF